MKDTAHTLTMQNHEKFDEPNVSNMGAKLEISAVPGAILATRRTLRNVPITLACAHFFFSYPLCTVVVQQSRYSGNYKIVSVCHREVNMEVEFNFSP